MSVTTSEQPYLASQANYATQSLNYTFGKTIFVDGTNGADTNNGSSWSHAFATIQAGVTAASAGDTVLVAAKTIAVGANDPNSYAESVIIPAATTSLSLIGVSRGRTQMGLPQIKPGGVTTGISLLTIRAGGCLIKNIGFNGNSTAGAPINNGILLDDDNSTKSASGTTIENCHFKNCAGATVGDARTGGAIVWSALGVGWQVLIKGNRFYKNVCDVCLLGTSTSVPQDVVIEDNIFSGAAADVDCNLWLKGGGSGINGIAIRNNVFQQLPALSAGQVKRYIVATGCVGIASGNVFACATNVSGTPKTFKVGGDAAEIPTTLHFVGNFGQSVTAAEAYGAIITIA
jgi:hypothetical protein